MRKIAAIVPDLMDRSRIDAALSTPVHYVNTIDSLGAAAPDIVIADLGRIDDPSTLRRAAPVARLIAFGSHVDEVMLESARRAGIDDVLPRSVFFRRIGELLS
jgi:DNA-binding NarL/FixJ family response regulator